MWPLLQILLKLVLPFGSIRSGIAARPQAEHGGSIGSGVQEQEGEEILGFSRICEICLLFSSFFMYFNGGRRQQYGEKT